MIYLNTIEAIIESIYLEDSLSGKLGECKVFINPADIKYLTGRVAIISTPQYPADKIKTLLDNGCKVLSRVKCDIEGVEFQPYIMRLNYGIMWNGKTTTDGSDLLGRGMAEYTSGILYFPKIYDPDLCVSDSDGNLTSYGWALQQVGVNIKPDTPFCNLDLLKTGKIGLKNKREH